MPRRGYLVFLTAVAVLGLTCFTLLRQRGEILLDEDIGFAPANATLGFGGIYVVSGRNSPRRKHLEEAAAVTELQLIIPEQQDWTDEDVRDFRIPHEEDSRVGKGSIKAWLSHHLVLREFLDSGLETALILEDDVDWDIRIRTKQVPVAQIGAQRLLQRSNNDPERYPWSHPDHWDLLYIGHCGDYLNDIGDGVGVGHHHPKDLENLQHVLIPDNSMPPRGEFHPYTASLLTAFGVPEQTRVLHRSKWPLCSFGYAINRRSAISLLEEIAPAREDKDRPMTAYDAAILTGCRDGPLVCYTLQPELFHHMDGQSLIAMVEAEKDKKANKSKPPVDQAGAEQMEYRGETPNIGCGFWSGEFYYDGDERKLSHLIQEVGRKGRCLKKDRP